MIWRRMVEGEKARHEKEGLHIVNPKKYKTLSNLHLWGERERVFIILNYPTLPDPILAHQKQRYLKPNKRQHIIRTIKCPILH